LHSLKTKERQNINFEETKYREGWKTNLKKTIKQFFEIFELIHYKVFFRPLKKLLQSKI